MLYYPLAAALLYSAGCSGLETPSFRSNGLNPNWVCLVPALAAVPVQPVGCLPESWLGKLMGRTPLKSHMWAESSGKIPSGRFSWVLLTGEVNSLLHGMKRGSDPLPNRYFKILPKLWKSAKEKRLSFAILPPNAEHALFSRWRCTAKESLWTGTCERRDDWNGGICTCDNRAWLHTYTSVCVLEWGRRLICNLLLPNSFSASKSQMPSRESLWGGQRRGNRDLDRAKLTPSLHFAEREIRIYFNVKIHDVFLYKSSCGLHHGGRIITCHNLWSLGFPKLLPYLKPQLAFFLPLLQKRNTVVPPGGRKKKWMKSLESQYTNTSHKGPFICKRGSGMESVFEEVALARESAMNSQNTIY